MEELQVVTTLAVLQLMKSVVDFNNSLGDFLFIPITAVEAI
jgi:hypothetical protein